MTIQGFLPLLPSFRRFSKAKHWFLARWNEMATAIGYESDEDDRDFECTVCHEHVEPPITTCSEGHMVCNPCRQKIDLCATCQSSSWCRNRVADRFYESRKKGKTKATSERSCKNVAIGCKEVFANPEEKLAHETNNCSFKCERCPGKFLCQRAPSEAWFMDGRSTVEVMPVADGMRVGSWNEEEHFFVVVKRHDKTKASEMKEWKCSKCKTRWLETVLKCLECPGLPSRNLMKNTYNTYWKYACQDCGRLSSAPIQCPSCKKPTILGDFQVCDFQPSLSIGVYMNTAPKFLKFLVEFFDDKGELFLKSTRNCQPFSSISADDPETKFALKLLDEDFKPLLPYPVKMQIRVIEWNFHDHNSPYFISSECFFSFSFSFFFFCGWNGNFPIYFFPFISPVFLLILSWI